MAARRAASRPPASAPGFGHLAPLSSHHHVDGAHTPTLGPVPSLLQARGGGGVPARGEHPAFARRRRDFRAATLLTFLVCAVRPPEP